VLRHRSVPIQSVAVRVSGPILIMFVDGVGLRTEEPGNPFTDRALPAIAALAGGPLALGRARQEARRSVNEVDATLGVEGLPQSGTGQTTLFTGTNAAQAIGRHVPAFPGPRLRAIIEARGLLAAVARAGHSVAFANAFTPSYLRDLTAGTRRASVTVHAASCAGVVLRTEAELLRNDAVTWDLERDFYRRAVGEHVPPVEAAQAGAHLAALAVRHDLTLFETFLTDLVGHGRIPLGAGDVIERLDRFLGGLLAALDATTTLVLCSDHGNIEEPEHARHTRNPVPLIAVGPLADHLAGSRSIVDLTPSVLAALGIERTPVVVELASRLPSPAEAVSPSRAPEGAS
jgi:hypothetical protein